VQTGAEFDDATFAPLLDAGQISPQLGKPGFAALFGRDQVRPGTLLGAGDIAPQQGEPADTEWRRG